MTPKKDGKCAIYIATCDRYSDLWPGFFHCWKRYWPDCPFDVYLGANEKVWSGVGVTTLGSTTNSPWSACVSQHLLSIKEDYVLFVLEDFYLRSFVSTEKIIRLLSYLDTVGGSMVRLLPRPGPQRVDLRHSSVGECLPDTPYRVCTQAAIWRRMDLISILEPAESIWEFEMNAQARADGSPKRFYCSFQAALPYRGLIFHHVVEKGKWIPSEYWWCRRRGVPCDKQSRELLGPKDFTLLVFVELYGRILEQISPGRAHLVHRLLTSFIPPFLLRIYRTARGYRNAKHIVT